MLGKKMLVSLECLHCLLYCTIPKHYWTGLTFALMLMAAYMGKAH
jgi:hypothetical protein